MNTAAVTALLAGKEPVRALVLASEKEVAELADLGLPVNTVDSSLSMQHLASAKFAAERMLGKAGRLQVMTVTREEPQATEAERALIYAMLVRCRKVISCRDKLEDMLKFDDREGWNEYKAAYEIRCWIFLRLPGGRRMFIPITLLTTSKSTTKMKAIF